MDPQDSTISAAMGTLPLGAPFPYVAENPAHAERLLAGARHSTTLTWWHETPIKRVASIATFGLVPGCWLGAGDCVVFGLDDRADISADPDLAMVEVSSPAPVGQVKAWWVPPEYIIGFWVSDGSFLNREEILLREPVSNLDLPSGGCRCELAALCLSERDRCSRLAESRLQARE